MRICVCTSFQGAQEPRGPRHACAIAEISPKIDVVFLDCAPFGAKRIKLSNLAEKENLKWETYFFPTRNQRPLSLVFRKILQALSFYLYRITGKISTVKLSVRCIGLERKLKEIAADVYIAHNIDTLLPAFCAAKTNSAKVMFDSMEFHSDMGENQTKLEKKIIDELQKCYLPRCDLVFASTPQVAEELADRYKIKLPISLENVPPRVNELPKLNQKGVHLYWRNSVIGLGQRGLDDVLSALKDLPNYVTLHLQGNLPSDGGARLRNRIENLKIENRVIFHKPYLPGDAVAEAAKHHIGLCLERQGNRNHDLTTSNKIYDYHMAGLAVIASDLPGLRSVITKSRGGVLFKPGSIQDLKDKILLLILNEKTRKEFAENARIFALSNANLENVMKKLKKEMQPYIANTIK